MRSIPEFTFRFLTGLAIVLTVLAGLSLRPPAAATGYISAGGVRLYYESRGAGSPAAGSPVIFLHAGLLDGRMWKPQVDHLAGRYRVITLDLPGHGRSRGRDTTLLIEEVLRIVMDSLKLSKASFVGSSLGSVCATDFAIRYPERIHKLVLTSTGIYGWDNRYEPDSLSLTYFYALREALTKKDTAAAAEVYTHFWCDGPFRRPQEVRKEVRRYVYETTLTCLRANKLSGGPKFARPPAIEKLDRLRAPLLIIRGDKDAPYILRAGDLLQQSVRGARQVTFPDVAHLLNLEIPGPFNRTLADFLKK